MPDNDSDNVIDYEDIYKEQSDDVDEEDLGGFQNVFGGQSNEEFFESEKNAYSDIVERKDSLILGLPFKYDRLADPKGRVYSDTLETEAIIAYITVGKPKYNKSLGKKLLDMVGMDSSGLPNNSLSLGTDTRLISFKPDINEYRKYLRVSCEYLWYMMGFSGTFKEETFFGGKTNSIGNIAKNGIPFYCTRNTQCSESLNNEYSESQASSKANSKALELREQKMNSLVFGQKSFFSSLASSFKEAISTLSSEMPIIGNIASSIFQLNLGSMQFFGDVWSNSKFSNSYQLDFKFLAPYGNMETVFSEVYFPFLALFNIAAPRQNGRYGFMEPFLVRIQFPGWFMTECGVIETMSWTKAGDDQLYAANGMPLEISVQLTVRDLYPGMMTTKRSARLKYNWGFQCFLENMAGMNINEFSIAAIGKRLKSDMRQRATTFFDVLSLKSLKYGMSDILTTWGGNMAGG